MGKILTASSGLDDTTGCNREHRTRAAPAMFEVNSAVAMSPLTSALLLVNHWKLEASLAPLKLFKQLSFSTNFRPDLCPRACVCVRRSWSSRRTQRGKKSLRFRPYANFTRGKRETRLCSDPRVQNFPPTRRDDSANVINSGLMITQSCFCMK